MIARDIAFNIAGRIIPAIITFATVPIYLSFIGEVQFAFIGILVSIQSIFLLLDGGFSAGYLRRVAEFTANKNSLGRISNLTLSVELIFIAISLIIFTILFTSSDWVVNSWLDTDFNLAIDAIKLISAIVAVRFLILPYYACLKGFSKFDWVNILNITSSMFKTILAIVLLEFYSNEISSILISFLLIYVVELLIIRLMVFKLVPYQDVSISQSIIEVKKIKRFIGGMALVSLLSALLSQLDKLVVSNILPLETFSYYSIAALLATIPLIISTPIAGAVYPKLVQSVSKKSNELEEQFLYASKYIAILVFPICSMIIFNADFVLYFWTQNEMVTQESSGPLSVLIIANTILSIMSMPYFLSLANGDTSIPIKTNIIALIISLPVFYFLGSEYNAIGVSFGWLVINIVFILIYIFMILRNNYLTKVSIISWLVSVNSKSLIVSVLLAMLSMKIIEYTSNTILQVSVISILSLINVFSCYKIVKYKSNL